jgi:hypothetical protein
MIANLVMPHNWLMQQVISRDRGPLEVTNDLRTLGYEAHF